MSRNRKFLYIYTTLFLLLVTFSIWVFAVEKIATGGHLDSPSRTSTVSGTINLNVTVRQEKDWVPINVTFNLTGPIEGSNATVRFSQSNASLNKVNITLWNHSLDTTTLPDGRYFIRYEVNWSDYYTLATNTSSVGNITTNVFVAFQADGTTANVTSDVFIDNTPPNITLSYPSTTGNGTCFIDNDSVEISGIARDMLNFTIGINDTRFRGNWSKSNTSYTFGTSKDYLKNDTSGTQLSFNYTAGQALTDGWYTIALAANDSCCGNLSGGKASDDRTAQVYNLSRGVSTNLRVLGISFLVDTTRPTFTYSSTPLWVESAIEPNDNSRVAKKIEGGYYRLDPGEKFKLHCDFDDTNIKEIRYYLQVPGSGQFIRLTPDTPAVDRGAGDCTTVSKTCTYTPREFGTYEAYCEIIEGSNDVNTTCDRGLEGLSVPTSKVNNNAYKFKVEPTLDFSTGVEEAEAPSGVGQPQEEVVEAGLAPEVPEASSARPTITPRRTTGVWVVAGIIAVGVLAYLVVVFLRRRK